MHTRAHCAASCVCGCGQQAFVIVLTGGACAILAMRGPLWGTAKGGSYLGYILENERPLLLPNTVKLVSAAPPPHTKTGMRSSQLLLIAIDTVLQAVTPNSAPDSVQWTGLMRRYSET